MERTTEQILNSETWIDANGVANEVGDMDKNHLRNILVTIYERRSWFWLHCDDTQCIDEYRNGDEFFQKVIRNSTIWATVVGGLDKTTERFDFVVESGSRHAE